MKTQYGEKCVDRDTMLTDAPQITQPTYSENI